MSHLRVLISLCRIVRSSVILLLPLFTCICNVYQEFFLSTRANLVFEIWIFRNDQPDCDDDRRFFAYITLTEENAINHDVSHFSSLSISD